MKNTGLTFTFHGVNYHQNILVMIISYHYQGILNTLNLSDYNVLKSTMQVDLFMHQVSFVGRFPILNKQFSVVLKLRVKNLK